MDFNISVIIPTFNRAQFVSETIDSVIDQSFMPTEIIVVDDGSTDDTDRVVANYGDLVKYYKIENSGVCKARNVGVEKSHGDWIAFCDHDDLWLRNKLYNQVELLSENKEVEYCFTNFRIVKDGNWGQTTKFDDAPLDYWDVPRSQISPRSFVIDISFYHKILKFQPIRPSTVMMRKTFFYRIGGFNESFGRKMSEDFEFTLRCVQESPIGVISEPVVGVQWHEQNYSRGKLPGISFVISDIEILDYSMKNHRLGSKHRSLIKDQIIRRSISVAHGAFEHGEFNILQDMMKNIPIPRRSPKLWIKAAIAKLPFPMAKALQKNLMALT